MASIELKITRIGNSRGVRIPADTLRRYAIGDSVVMEERSDGIFLRPANSGVQKLSWEETARDMAAAREDWSEWSALDTDGMDDIPWNPGSSVGRRVAEPAPEYARKSDRPKKKRA